ncbi:hypothetical protein EXIGLDRAFT_729197 [Exidia glandulosa HHB12029]|uniref:F-box domain-containing protein n=1 Tax=Exidia glandulosa HHB12029 TaxID=1314781 RepID=A0A165LLV6_EXIGL|nr:hypothetical protein EXIGLDRAFT_729197 [Exidia glandulosa HHB12029]
MTPFSALPCEIALLAAEHAAWSQVHNDWLWVASVRLVCRRFNGIIRRICFETFIVQQDTAYHLPELAGLPDTPLSLTRRLVIPDGQLYTRATEQSLFSQVNNIRDFTGGTSHLTSLSRIHPDLHLDSVYIIHLESWSARPWMRWLFTTPRLHIICGVIDDAPMFEGQDILHISGTRWLIVDAFSTSSLELVAHIQPFLSRLTVLLSIPSLERLLLRPRIYHDESRIPLCEAVVHCASEMQDERIWLDASVVHLTNGEDKEDDRQLDIADALAGHALWEAGAPLYIKGSDS